MPRIPVARLIGASGDHTGWAAWDPAHAEQARKRYERRAARMGAGEEARADKAAAAPPPRQETIAAVLARAREARAAR